MPDSKNQGIEAKNRNESPKKHSFFGGEITEKTKDLLDFRYNTQEEIDKLNDEMTTANDLDEMIRQTSDPQNIEDSENNKNINNSDEEYLKQKDENEAESNLEQNLESIGEPIEGEVIENTNEEEYDIDKIDDIFEETDNEPEKPEDEDNDEETEETDIDKIDDIFEEADNEPEKPEDEDNSNPFDLNDEDEIKENGNNEESEESDIDKIDDIFEEADNEYKEPESNLDQENNEGAEDENSSSLDEHQEDNTKDLEGAKFFDPFELDLDEDANEEPENDDNSDPFDLNDENKIKEKEDENMGENEESDIDSIDDIFQEENKESELEKNDINDEENLEVKISNDNKEYENEENDIENDIAELEENKEGIDEKRIKNEQESYTENEKIININKEDEENDEENDKENKIVIDTPIVVNPNKKGEKEEMLKNRKVKKNSATGEIITDEEIKLEQGQDTTDSEDNEDYQPTAEEIFEREPEFFADDELSQQFMKLVQNVRGIFKLERKDGEQNPYFKILGGKTSDSTLEYLFYLIEEESEPIDLFIKKVETNEEKGEETEHMVQFSYNKDKELNIFVDEVILYERINKSDSDTSEYNDTKTILEKFIFLTDNHYDKLKAEIDKQHEEKQKKRQLQQIFKGF